VPLRTQDIQGLYASRLGHAARINCTATFTSPRWGAGCLTVLIQRLTVADHEYDPARDVAAEHDSEAEDDISLEDDISVSRHDAHALKFVRVLRCGHADVCMVFRPMVLLPKAVAAKIRQLSFVAFARSGGVLVFQRVSCLLRGVPFSAFTNSKPSFATHFGKCLWEPCRAHHLWVKLSPYLPTTWPESIHR